MRNKSLPIVIFADGASSGNPGPGGWGVVIATPDGMIRELGGGEDRTTNNQMELTAVIQGLSAVRSLSGAVDVYTDSTYVIRGITQWIWAWQKKGWKSSTGEEVANQTHWKRLQAVLMGRGKSDPVKWKYVRGHSGVPGNERVDEIAVSYTRGKRANLFEGPLLKYSIPIYDIPENTEVPEMKSKEAKASAYSYVSVVNGTAGKHKSWAECEARVKGRSGAKFKKAMSAVEESEILAAWGFDPEKL